MSAYKSSPCFKCQDRYLKCHAECFQYKKFKKDLDFVDIEKNKDRIVLEYKSSNRK